MTAKIKLNGGLNKTVTWIWLDNNQLKVEYYDFSEDAQNTFGNDIAYILTVNEMDKLFWVSNQNTDTLIAWLAENFQSYFEIKQWLEKNKIGFEKEIDSWA
ncbi:MAG: hypothetical protein UZ14_CFX002000170 [Chloroflexi bacterium OLB14]|nr:MAG: hypothetical protein UZ14_CFX002000170 [Chloroflexi bacterium OLB14]